MLLLCALFALCVGGPLIKTKSSKSLSADKVDKSDKPENIKKIEEDTAITEEERKFLREIEAKFDIKHEDEDEDDDDEQTVEDESVSTKVTQVPLPAVIAIEIVNDTVADGKGKRTIDANLGYGYRTNNGYFYSQFGQPEKKGKYMIYPYSQQDIPAPSKFKYHTQVVYSNKAKGEKTIVEIQPSKAYQLVPVSHQEEHNIPNTYKLDGAVSQIRTKYENVQAVQAPPPQYQSQEDIYPQHREQIPTTLYSTFNGGHLSGLSGHFPVVMPNYYVSPSQILRHPQYQGLNLQNQEQEPLPQKHFIPVLILRIPSSQLKNPTAEFFPKLPSNNPYAMSLSHINIQALLNQYLTNLQHQYETPEPQIDTNALKYSQPETYYEQQQQPTYSLSTPSPIHYTSPSYYITQPQYTHQNVEEEQDVRYVVPHPSPTPETQAVSQVSQVYGPPNHHQPPPTYENVEEDQLPFSENYPDNSHTQVIYNPHYQEEASVQTNVHTVQNHLVQPYPTPTPSVMVKPRPFVPSPRYTVMHKYSSVIPASMTKHVYEKEEGEEDQQSSKVMVQSPYNYHAHPYPKRQIKTADTTTKKPMAHTTRHQNRKLMTAVKTTA